MSYLIVVNEIERYVKYEERTVPYFSTLHENQSELQIFCGELHKVENYLTNQNWEKDSTKLHIFESFSIIKISKIENRIYFATSISGLEPIFYYAKNNVFLLSDDFWEIVNYLKPEEDDIDKDAIIENLNLPYPLFFNTFIKDIAYLPPGCVGTYDVSGLNLKINKYFDFHYQSSDKIDLQVATEHVDVIISKLMKDIKEECGDVQYAVGLSGGLDSRVIPYYAQKNGLKTKSFIFGASKPHGFFLSRDHKNARKLSKIFNIKHNEVEWQKETLQEKINMELKKYPLGTPQFFKFEFYDGYDVLLTGGNGLIIGSEIPDKIEVANDKDLIYFMWNEGRAFYPNTLLNLRIQRAFKYFLNKDINIQHNEKWYKLICDKNMSFQIYNKFKCYIENRKKEGKSNLDIYEEYFNNILGARNRFGGFESGLGTKRSFSIYAPRLLQETLTWPLALLEGRPVLKNLIKENIPLAAEVKAQNYEGALNKKDNIITKIINMLIFMLRGNGTAMEQKYFKYCKNEFKATMLNDCKWFHNIVDLKKYINDIANFDNKYFVLTLWKTKMVIDIIETKKYISFIDEKRRIGF